MALVNILAVLACWVLSVACTADVDAPSDRGASSAPFAHTPIREAACPRYCEYQPTFLPYEP